VAAAQFHLARTVCRRAERAVLAASGRETLNPEVLVYLNRLSDLLFTMARVANHRAGHPGDSVGARAVSVTPARSTD
jgi:cob(I)alamin adenosyltransferase